MHERYAVKHMCLHTDSSQVCLLKVESQLTKQFAQGATDEEDLTVQASKGRSKASRKRKAGVSRSELECKDRDHWEECKVCHQWTNLGKGQGHLEGACQGCGATVTWQSPEALQSWVQCDACGRWRSVPDHVLRSANCLYHKVAVQACARMHGLPVCSTDS